MKSNNNELFWCSNCLAMSTRPRITFDNDKKCSACKWNESKKEIDWVERQNELTQIIDTQKNKDKPYDCLIPVSGGKDGSYVSYMAKNKYNLNPLCVTIKPPLSSEIGLQNLHNFIENGYDHVTISPSISGMKKLNKSGFIEMGFPYYGWLIAIHTAVLKIAIHYNIDLIIYGEDGELEYGGSGETAFKPFYNADYQKRVYLEGGYSKIINSCNLSKGEKYFFEFPQLDTELKNIKITHWSYFENWDPYRNYLTAKKYCGLKENYNSNSGTFTNFSQTDQYLYPLHSYLMFLKFGFGRANQDACIEIRRGAMDRDQAINLVKLYDGQFPEEFLEIYLDYYEMEEDHFFDIIDKWANKSILKKEGRYWKPDFEII
jgi:N-acetyl sugar amidotransferase